MLRYGGGAEIELRELENDKNLSERHQLLDWQYEIGGAENDWNVTQCFYKNLNLFFYHIIFGDSDYK